MRVYYKPLNRFSGTVTRAHGFETCQLFTSLLCIFSLPSMCVLHVLIILKSCVSNNFASLALQIVI